MDYQTINHLVESGPSRQHYWRVRTRQRKHQLALLYVRVPSGLVEKEASPAPALLERLSAASNSSLPTAAASISITEGARDPGRELSCPRGAVM